MPSSLRWTIPTPDEDARSAAHERWRNLTKPEGSLGKLELLGERLASIVGEARPRFRKKGIAVFAADHGVVAEGVSAYPSSVTAEMVENFLRGGAAINVLARITGSELLVTDVGIAGPELAPRENLLRMRVAPGTRNFSREAAMTIEEARAAVQAGEKATEELLRRGVDLLAVGDMGIGNTTCASALLCSMTGASPGEVVGPGTGLDRAGVERKRETIARALALHRPAPTDPWEAMRTVGGFELAAIAGAALAAVERRVPVVLDGFISTTAGLWAARLAPGAPALFLPSHASTEPGHARALAALGLTPYLDLEMRLGEGTGSALQFLLLEAACRLLDEMSTFEEASVARKLP